MTRKTPRDIILSTCLFAKTEEDLNTIAKDIREIFPKGINRHTNTPNRQPVRELADALLRFEEYYKLDCTKEEILNAATKYVRDKQYDAYRQCSKYFIIKDLTREGKGITSTLATYIESSRDGDDNSSINPSWLDELGLYAYTQ